MQVVYVLRTLILLLIMNYEVRGKEAVVTVLKY
jgi:hypothetical protein